MKSNPKLRVTEIFYSLQGESRTMGYPTVFVRLTGCPLRCCYCDTSYAFQGGHSLSLGEILTAVRTCVPPARAVWEARNQKKPARAALVTVTGGEPLAQPACRGLLAALCEAGYEVSLETSGALDISNVDERVSIVMDIKTPGSGEAGRNRHENLTLLRPGDQIKFVIRDRQDYEWARARLQEWELATRWEVLFLPVHGGREAGGPSAGTLPPKDLAEWILADALPVRMQIQLHKYLWGDVPGR